MPNENILIIDDDEQNIKILKKILSDKGYCVFSCSDGFKGINILLNIKIDLILLDIKMPKINGFETCEKIKSYEILKNIPIIFLSASTDEDSLFRAFKVGAVDFINKPFKNLELLSRVEKQIEAHSHKNDLQSIIQNQSKLIKKKTNLLTKKAYLDENTGLKNLLCLHKDIENKKNDWIFLLDINDFNVVNKLYGFRFGDEVLNLVSRKLKKIISNNSIIYKLPSDRFCIISPQSEYNKQDIDNKCEKLFKYFDDNELVINNIISLKINFNIGVTRIKNIDTVIESEYALDLSKKHGKRSKYILCNDSNYLITEKDNLYNMFKVRKYIENDSFIPYFQPIIDVKSKKVYKYEALVRAVDEKGEIVPPYKFLSAAKNLGLIQEITKSMIIKSCDFFKNTNIGFSINFTDKDLTDEKVLETLVKSVTSNNIRPNQVTIEILENVTLLDNINNLIFKNLTKLKDLGFKIAIDDFGSENSNFSRIIDLQSNYLKIDGIFIKDIVNDKNKQNITLSIIQLAKNLGMQSIAEFVGDKNTYDLLEEFGIDYVQGFYLGKPQRQLIS